MGTVHELVSVGGSLDPTTLLRAYRSGVFPMPVKAGLLGWWAPDPRGILPLDALHVSARLRRSLRRFEIRVDTALPAVMAACADPARPHGWISDDIREAYGHLHELGHVHSVEAWSRAGGTLAGGLYGVGIGGLFAGESMFHRETDASKAALAGLVELLSAPEGSPGAAAAAGRLLDVQWCTDHLASLGAIEVSRREYQARLQRALRLAPPRFG